MQKYYFSEAEGEVKIVEFNSIAAPAERAIERRGDLKCESLSLGIIIILSSEQEVVLCYKIE